MGWSPCSLVVLSSRLTTSIKEHCTKLTTSLLLYLLGASLDINTVMFDGQLVQFRHIHQQDPVLVLCSNVAHISVFRHTNSSLLECARSLAAVPLNVVLLLGFLVVNLLRDSDGHNVLIHIELNVLLLNSWDVSFKFVVLFSLEIPQ